jgi:ribonuclease HI
LYVLSFCFQFDDHKTSFPSSSSSSSSSSLPIELKNHLAEYEPVHDALNKIQTNTKTVMSMHSKNKLTASSQVRQGKKRKEKKRKEKKKKEIVF